ncbi:MAG TPA: hypothetical protein VFC67_27030 [Prolixibacteraceae bacterium]|nr:hypothetical protein [Prolixibacteraceae bacterium]
MKGREFIQAKQIAWANRKNIKLVGSQTTKGLMIYTENINDNFFEPLSPETIKAFEKGDGGELKKKGKTLSKMQALHSSSVLGVNIFQYWKTIGRIPDIAYACGLCAKENTNSIDIKFEEKFEISDTFPKKPNIDVVMINSPDSNLIAYGTECKFSEAYSSRKHSGLKEKYITDIPDQWKGISQLKKFAENISPNDNDFRFLHAAQLIKHILGLKKQYGKSSFRLLYLWYDVYGTEGVKHRKEIAIFKAIAEKDHIKFHSLSYQELIIKMSKKLYKGNEEYIDYMTDRYL